MSISVWMKRRGVLLTAFYILPLFEENIRKVFICQFDALGNLQAVNPQTSLASFEYIAKRHKL